MQRKSCRRRLSANLLAQKVSVLDVCKQNKYDDSHILGAVLLPVGTTDEESAAETIPEKDAADLVYCRSGNCSKTAFATLVEFGYANIYEFGSINTCFVRLCCKKNPLEPCGSRGFEGFREGNYLLENWGARRAAFRPYFLRSFILGSRVR